MTRSGLLFSATLAMALTAVAPWSGAVWAGPAQASASSGDPASGTLVISDWLVRIHEAARRRAYIGVFVVSSGANISSARIWHVCDGDEQVERVENLSGPPRSTFRHNKQVITFLPDSKKAVAERRDSLGLFSDMLRSADSQIARYYTAMRGVGERVAGVDADLVVLKPKDPWRYGYRVWSERRSGLVVKLQTLDVDGKVLEQAAFSELQLDAPVSISKLTEMMGNTQGYTVERQELTKTSAESEGWSLKTRVEGFEPVSCYVRPMPAAEPGVARNMLQWVFGDGLASVSLFVEPFDRSRHVREGSTMVGATRMLTRRLSDKGGEWWITAVGEVPQATLAVFAQSLVRMR